jgi:hypothetical protein
MSFIAAATAIGLEGIAANIAAGAMMGGSVKVGTNVLSGQDPFKDIGKGVLMGGLTGGLTPTVASTFDLSMPMAAGITQGGLTALATGDLVKGLMAGAGAYGMYGLTGAGQQMGLDQAMSGADVAGGEQVFGDSQTEIGDGSAGSKFNKYLTNPTATGAAAQANSTGNFFKDNWKYMAAAAAPILADQAVKSNMPTTTTKPGMIRPYSYDPYSGGFTAGNPYEAQVKSAASGGIMGFDESSNSPMSRQSLSNMQDTGGMFNYAHDGGGVMRMAEGGVPGYAGNTGSVVGGSVITPDDAYRLYTQARNTAAIQPGGALDFGPNGVASQDSVTRSNAYQTQAGNQALAGLGYSMDQYGGITGTGKAITPDDLYKLYIQARNTAAIQPGGALDFGTTGRASDDSVTRSNAYQTQAGNAVLAGYGYEMDKNGNIVPIGTAATTDTDTGTTTTDTSTGTGTGTTVTKSPITCGPGYKLSIDGLTCVPDTTAVTPETQCPTGYHYDPVLKQCVLNTSATQNTTTSVTTPTSIATADKTALPVGVSGAGVTTINPNGTVSTSPDLSLQMKDVRDTYTKGGGDLGYTSPTYTPAEFKTKYVDKLTGGSADAYNYLTGKTKYSPIPSTPTGEVMKPYSESVLGVPMSSAKKMYIFDPGTKTYKVNPDYAIPTYDSKGNKSYNLTNADVKTFVNTNPTSDAFRTWVTTNNLSPEQVAIASNRPINEISRLFTDAKVLTVGDGKITTTTTDKPIPFADLYQSVLNRDGDATGLAYWKERFGDTVDADELAIFKAAARASGELKDDTATTATTATTTGTGAKTATVGGISYDLKNRNLQPAGDNNGDWTWSDSAQEWIQMGRYAVGGLAALTMARGGTTHMPFFSKSTGKFTSRGPQVYGGGMAAGGQFDLGSYSDGGRLLRGPGDGVSDSIPATIGNKRPARLADGEFVVPARIVSELGNGSTEAGARKLYAMMDRVQAARKGSIGKGKVANNSRADKYLPA